MSDKKIILNEWNPNCLKSDEFFSMIIGGSRKMGKSYFLKHIYNIYLKNKYDMVVLFSGSCCCDDSKMKFEDQYNYMFENIKIPMTLKKYDEYNENILEEIFNIRNRIYNNEKIKIKVLFIFDDMPFDPKVINSKNIAKLFTLGRHLDFSVIYSAQSLRMLNTIWRDNLTYLVYFRAHGKGKERFSEEFVQSEIDKDLDTPYLNIIKFSNKLIRRIHDEQFRALILEYDTDKLGMDSFYYFKAD